jgi:hypothetical protein
MYKCVSNDKKISISTEESSCWERNKRLAPNEIPRLLQNFIVLHRVHTSPHP